MQERLRPLQTALSSVNKARQKNEYGAEEDKLDDDFVIIGSATGGENPAVDQQPSAYDHAR